MLLLWMAVGFGALVAVIAYLKARRLARRLETLNHSYWELRYEFTRLRAQVARLDPEQQEAAGAPEPAAPDVGFVPLSSLKTDRK